MFRVSHENVFFLIDCGIRCTYLCTLKLSKVNEMRYIYILNYNLRIVEIEVIILTLIGKYKTNSSFGRHQVSVPTADGTLEFGENGFAERSISVKQMTRRNGQYVLKEVIVW